MESRAKHRGEISNVGSSQIIVFQAKPLTPGDSGGLLVVLLRVRTTLLRNAFSLSSLSRRERTSRSWVTSTTCCEVEAHFNEHVGCAQLGVNNTPDLSLPYSSDAQSVPVP
jgi:hypothetical protein